MKDCATCRWRRFREFRYIKTKRTVFAKSVCEHPGSLRPGGDLSFWTNYYLVRYARSTRGPCGPEARLWEPKEASGEKE